MNSGDYIYFARHQARLTQTELAQRAKCSQNEITRIETGSVKPSFEKLCSLVRACGLDIQCVFTNADNSYTQPITERLAMSPAARITKGLHLARQVQRFQQSSGEI